MSGFSSQWWTDVIALHPYSSVIWDFIRGRTCVCSCDERKDSENMKKDETVCVCMCVCVRALRLRLCLFYRMVEHWILSSEQCFENGMQRLKCTSEKCNIPFADIMLSSTIRSMVKWRIICICLPLLTFLSPLFVHATITLHCLLAATHHFPSRTDTVCKMTALQNGWKMILMFHLCLTLFFFQGILYCPCSYIVLCTLDEMNVSPL